MDEEIQKRIVTLENELDLCLSFDLQCEYLCKELEHLREGAKTGQEPIISR